MPHQLNEAMRRCIESCLACHASCTGTVAHCLGMGGEHAAPAHIGLLLDCAAICQTSAGFMLRGSPRHVLTCGVCAEVCERCAEDCERLAGDDATMKACAEACRRCAALCRELSGAAAR